MKCHKRSGDWIKITCFGKGFIFGCATSNKSVLSQLSARKLTPESTLVAALNSQGTLNYR